MTRNSRRLVSGLVLVLLSAPPAWTAGCEAEFQFSFGGLGQEPGQMMSPSGLAVDHQGRLYVADTFNDRVQVFDEAGDVVAVIGSEGPADGEFSFPFDLDIPAGLSRLYVADTLNLRVQIFDLAGNHLQSVVAPENPHALASMRAGRIYVADRTSHVVRVYDGDGELRLVFGTLGTGNGEFVLPSGMAVSGRRVLVTDATGLQVFDSSGGYVSSMGGFGGASDVTVLPNGRMYIADTANQRIVAFRGNGELLFETRRPASFPDEFIPAAVAVDPSSGRIYVAEQGNHMVSVFDEDPGICGEF